MKDSGAGLNAILAGKLARGHFEMPHATAPFIPTLAAAVLDGSIWNQGAPEPHELPRLTIYLPTQAAAEPLKLAFLAQSPNGATFLPRIRVLGRRRSAGLVRRIWPAHGPGGGARSLGRGARRSAGVRRA